LYNKVDNIANTPDPPIICHLLLAFFISYMDFNCTTKDVVWGSVVSYNSSKLVYNAVILKDKEKDRELVFSAMAKHLLESKKSLLLLLVVQGKVGADC
jgi:hypothetical protein